MLLDLALAIQGWNTSRRPKGRELKRKLEKFYC